MKLHTTITNERGKTIRTSDNKLVSVLVQDEKNEQIVRLRLVRYSNGKSGMFFVYDSSKLEFAPSAIDLHSFPQMKGSEIRKGKCIYDHDHNENKGKNCMWYD